MNDRRVVIPDIVITTHLQLSLNNIFVVVVVEVVVAVVIMLLY